MHFLIEHVIFTCIFKNAYKNYLLKRNFFHLILRKIVLFLGVAFVKVIFFINLFVNKNTKKQTSHHFD
jgi:hypothetical protein